MGNHDPFRLLFSEKHCSAKEKRRNYLQLMRRSSHLISVYALSHFFFYFVLFVNLFFVFLLSHKHWKQQCRLRTYSRVTSLMPSNDCANALKQTQIQCYEGSHWTISLLRAGGISTQASVISKISKRKTPITRPVDRWVPIRIKLPQNTVSSRSMQILRMSSPSSRKPCGTSKT